MKKQEKVKYAKNVINHFLDISGYWMEIESLTCKLSEEEMQEVDREVERLVDSIRKRYSIYWEEV